MTPLKTGNLDEAVDAIFERVGDNVVCATPLALGKPVQLLNALYGRVKREPQRRLEILTALSLAVPHARSDLERRFLEPFARRLFEGVAELDYLADASRRQLPENIRLLEFYFRPGSMLGAPFAQQNYISANYTHVVRDLLARGGNAILVMVSERDGQYSLSCNPDLTLDAVRQMRERELAGGAACVVAAMVNRNLPFMPNDAEVGAEFFDVIVDAPQFETRLFSVPNSPTVPADHAVGLYAASLVKDGGTLQLGIGSLGDAVAHWLRTRQCAPEQYLAMSKALELQRYSPLVDNIGGANGFETGLFAGSEMFTWSLMCLYQAGVLKRRVYENIDLQEALNRGVIDEQVPADALEILRDAGVIGDPLDADTIAWLTEFGLLLEAVPADTAIADVKRAQRGEQLRHGRVLHGAFFLGPEEFYSALRDLPEDERQLFNMTAVSNVNDLFGEEVLERLQRRHARFINICMKVTLFGAAVSDALEDGRVISGVGGQYNFVAMAHELEGARSILCLRSTRQGSGGVESNIVYNYGHTTIPRHLRDIVVSEYGIADLRGKTDAEVAAALIEISDSRFQPELVRQAKAAGKLPRDYQVPEQARDNTPDALWQRLRPLQDRNFLPQFPLGTDFDVVEQRLVSALGALKKTAQSGWRGKLALAARAAAARPRSGDQAALIRMGLASPENVKERMLQRLVIAALRLSEHSEVD